jgi:tetratricopeptide (TPR) repeat protein
VNGALHVAGTRGCGISLLLTNRGDQLAATTIWADEFAVPATDEKGFQFLAHIAAAWIDYRVGTLLGYARNFPEDPNAWLLFNAGLAWQESHDPKKAKALYERALDNDPLDSGSLTNLGLLELLAGNNHRSEDLLNRGREALAMRKEKALVVNPDWYRVKYNLATLHANSYAALRDTDPSAARAHRIQTRDLAEGLAKRALEQLGRRKGSISDALHSLLQTRIVPAALCLYGAVGVPEEDDTAGAKYPWSQGNVDGDQRTLLRLLDEGLSQTSALEYVAQHARWRPELLYNLACGWAQHGDLKKALETLGRALERASSVKRTELAEGAWTDDSFKPLRSDQELAGFKALLGIPELRLNQLRRQSAPRPAPTPTSRS